MKNPSKQSRVGHERTEICISAVVSQFLFLVASEGVIVLVRFAFLTFRDNTVSLIRIMNYDGTIGAIQYSDLLRVFPISIVY